MSTGKDPSSAGTESFSGLLRVVLGERVPADVVRAVHRGEDIEHLGAEIAELFRSCGGHKVSPVYELSPEEVSTDKYGFARELKLYLGPGSDPDRAVEILSKSPSVASVRASSLRRSS